jgi:hypothetical protein
VSGWTLSIKLEAGDRRGSGIVVGVYVPALDDFEDSSQSQATRRRLDVRPVTVGRAESVRAKASSLATPMAKPVTDPMSAVIAAMKFGMSAGGFAMVAPLHFKFGANRRQEI